MFQQLQQAAWHPQQMAAMQQQQMAAMQQQQMAAMQQQQMAAMQQQQMAAMQQQQMAAMQQQQMAAMQQQQQQPHLEFGYLLGQGGFGKVFKGQYGNVPVAIKEMHSFNSYDDYRKEVQSMLNLQHPNVIRLYGHFPWNNCLYIVMEFMSNGDLGGYLQRNSCRLNEMSLMSISGQVAEGMAYLEQNNYVHRDLASRNILVGENNQVKISDLGLTRFVQNAQRGHQATKRGTFNIRWTAPEAARSNRFTIKSDVWSFGVVLYEIFTYGGTPYQGVIDADVLQCVDRGQRLGRPPGCPTNLNAIMLQCWTVDPNQRPPFKLLRNLISAMMVHQQVPQNQMVSPTMFCRNPGVQVHPQVPNNQVVWISPQVQVQIYYR